MSEEQEAYNAWLAQQEANKAYGQAERALDRVEHLEEKLGECEERLGMAEELLQELVDTFEKIFDIVGWKGVFLNVKAFRGMTEILRKARKFLEDK